MVSACGKSAKEEKAQRQADLKRAAQEEADAFKVGVTPTLDCLPLFLLKDSMLYDSTKVDIRLKMFNAHADIDTALEGQSVQLAATELVRAIEMERTHRATLRPIAVTPLQWKLIGNKKNKVTKLKGLENRMIAMTRYSATDWLTTVARRRLNSDSIILNVQFNDVVLRARMMGSDEMDAAWLPEPYSTQQVLKGNVVIMDGADEGRHFGVIVFAEPGNKDADKRDAQLQAFRKAYDRAVELINRNGLKHYAALIKKYMNVDDKTIARLPKTTFTPCSGVDRSDLLAARKIHFVKTTPKVKIQ